jgi:hypothetical protein
MSREELPDDAGGYVVFPRRMALAALILAIAGVIGPSIAFYVQIQMQERRIMDLEKRADKAETSGDSMKSELAGMQVKLSDMQGDIRVVRQILENGARPR